jgi:hypothetical protein
MNEIMKMWNSVKKTYRWTIWRANNIFGHLWASCLLAFFLLFFLESLSLQLQLRFENTVGFGMDSSELDPFVRTDLVHCQFFFSFFPHLKLELSPQPFSFKWICPVLMANPCTGHCCVVEINCVIFLLILYINEVHY